MRSICAAKLVDLGNA